MSAPLTTLHRGDLQHLQKGARHRRTTPTTHATQHSFEELLSSQSPIPLNGHGRLLNSDDAIMTPYRGRVPLKF